jgi:dolichyl-diphosphooligosaccharide--protein glycosyltransferase
MQKLLENKMTKRDWIILASIIAGTILLRVIPQWNMVMVDSNVWFRGVDPYWHMRLAENMLHNFPYPQYWDWYTLYPSGGKVGFNPLMSWIIAGIGQTGANINMVEAFLPSIAGGLTVVAVFFLAKELFSKKVAYLACILVAILPGEFLHRTLLGFTDHHALETLLMTTTILFLVLMMKRPSRKLWSILSGVSLGFYLLNWSGGHFLIGILIVWFIIQILYFRLKNLPENNYCRNVLIVFCVSFAMYAPYMKFMNASLFSFAPYLFAIIAPIWLWNRGTKQATLMSVLLPLGIMAFALFVSDYYRTIIMDLRSVFWGGTTTIMEATPSSPSVILATAGVSFFLFIAGVIFYSKQKEKSLLFLIWALVMLVATIGQRRWGYYFVVPMSILASYFTFYIAKWMSHNTRTVAVGIVILFTVVSSIKGTIGIVTLPNNITPDMVHTLTYLRENSPEPYWDFQGDYYSLKIYDRPHYGVLSWWDYGHWISQVAQRTPCSNPAYQDPGEGPRFFCSITEEEALAEIAPLGDIRYIIMTEEMVGGKYYAIQGKSGKDTDLLDSVALKLWNNELDSYKLIREEGQVRVYERVS